MCSTKFKFSNKNVSPKVNVILQTHQKQHKLRRKICLKLENVIGEHSVPLNTQEFFLERFYRGHRKMSFRKLNATCKRSGLINEIQICLTLKFFFTFSCLSTRVKALDKEIEI